MFNYSYDIKEALKDYLEGGDFDYRLTEIETLDEFQEVLEEDAFTNDAITGNASGSFTFSSYEAKNIVLDRLDEVEEVIDNGLMDKEEFAEHIICEEWETLDVICRCCALSEAMADLMEELEGIDNEEVQRLLKAEQED